MEVDAAGIVGQVLSRTWSPASWRECESLQMATYDDQAAYNEVMDKLSKVPPLVQAGEVDALTKQLAAAARGEAFIIQGGDCAERFVDCEGDRIESQIKVITQMCALFEQATGMPVVPIARIAGQYGKPRSKPMETHPTLGEIYSFKGENINGYEPTERKWDPGRLLQGYWHSCATLNFIRSLQQADDFGAQMLGGLEIDYLKSAPQYGAWSKAVAAAKVSKVKPSVFTAHEAMQLDLEEKLTRSVSGKGFYNLSAHMVWIGDRTRQLLGGHIEYFRGINNPIGCKVGPTMKPDELKEMCAILNPNKVEGRLILITRYGHDKIASMLPPHIKAVQESGIPVVWQCDGVHGNTITASNKLKTRQFKDVMSECMSAFKLHRENGSILAGIHLELTGSNTVTECTGGSINIFEEMLTQNYETLCDPRFNYAQAIEASLTMASVVKP